MGDVLKWGKIQREMSCGGAYSYRKFYDVTVSRKLIKVNRKLMCLPFLDSMKHYRAVMGGILSINPGQRNHRGSPSHEHRDVYVHVIWFESEYSPFPCGNT